MERSGELTLESANGKAAALAVLASAGLTALVMAVSLRRMRLTGLPLGGLAGLLTYVLFRVIYPFLPAGTPRTAVWRLTDTALELDGRRIPRGEIAAVHVWPTRDALGHTLPGWTVNIEATGRNVLLRSLTRGEGAAESGERLAALVTALGAELPAGE